MLRGLLLAMAVMAAVEGKGWWMDQPYESQDFNIRVEYGEDINVACDGDPRLDQMGPVTIDYWVIPDMRIMRPGDAIDFKTLDGQAGWEVSTDGATMQLSIITEYHFGFYYCLATNTTTGNQIMVKKAINYRGPFFDDLWDDYRLNTIIGLSSSIAFLAIAGGAYGLTIFLDARKAAKGSIEPIEGEEEEEKKRRMENGEGYENGGYEKKEEEEFGGEASGDEDLKPEGQEEQTTV